MTPPALLALRRWVASGGRVTGWLALAACSASSAPGAPAPEDDAATASSCPMDVPSACPTPAPSYENEVQAIVRDRCLQCHAPGGQGFATSELDTYGRLFAARHDVASQVAACRMPLADAGQPSDDERQALLGWLVCGAPNN